MICKKFKQITLITPDEQIRQCTRVILHIPYLSLIYFNKQIALFKDKN